MKIDKNHSQLECVSRLSPAVGGRGCVEMLACAGDRSVEMLACAGDGSVEKRRVDPV